MPGTVSSARLPWAALLLAALGLTPAPAPAEVGRVLTRQTALELPPGVQSSLKSIISTPVGTGFVVHEVRPGLRSILHNLCHSTRTPDRRRLLVLTAEHVARHLYWLSPMQPLFNYDAQGRFVRVLAQDRDLDYALVEIDMPRHASSDLRPLAIDVQPPRSEMPVYGLSAGSTINARGCGLADVPSELEAALAMGCTFPTYAAGHFSSTKVRSYADGRSGPRETYRMECYPGQSGGPIISQETGACRAILVAGQWGIVAHATTCADVLDDIASKLSRDEIGEGGRDVRQFLRSVRR